MTRNLSVGKNRVNTIGIVTKVGSVLWWCHLFMNDLGGGCRGSCGGLWKHWKTSSNFTASSPLPHFSWMKQEARQPPVGALMMSLPVLCPENVISEGCRERLQIIYYFYYMHLSDIGLRVNPSRNLSIPACVQRRDRAGLYGDVINWEDVSTMGRSCLAPVYLLLLRAVNIHLRNSEFCRQQRVSAPDQQLTFWWIEIITCFFCEPTVCVCLSILISSSSGSKDSWLFTFQEVLSQIVITLT